MAIYRNVQTKFWSDTFITDLTPEQKYFFLYLLTNEQVRQCGIYEISFKQMEFDTGYNRDTIEKLIEFFEKSGKIKYSRESKELAIKNFAKHNPQGSPKVKQLINQELKAVKDRVLIGYLYGMDRDSPYHNISNHTITDHSTTENADAVEEETEVLDLSFEKEILADFGFNEQANFNKLRAVVAFIQVQKNLGRLDYFKEQYRNYHLYKNAASERKHNFDSFFGTQPNAFQDGKWDQANWQMMLNDFNKKQNGTTNNSYSNKQGVSAKRSEVELLATRSEEFLQRLGS